MKLITAIINLTRGDYTAELRHITGLEEDHPLITLALTIWS